MNKVKYGRRRLTFMERFFSTRAMMEFLKSIPAVTGRFVTLVML